MRWAAAWLLLAAGATMADAAPSDKFQPVVEAMLAEPLDATSPASLNMASYVLAQRFERGSGDPTALDGYVYLLKLLIQHALLQAEQHPEAAEEYRRSAVPMLYNLAADTWPGWGAEHAATIADAHLRLGLAAARQNVALAAEIGLPPDRRRNGYWILGAQLLANGDPEAAAAAFAQSRDFAAQAEIESGKLMAQGWIHVAAILAGDDAQDALEAVAEQLRETGDDGVFYADQYETALRALAARQAP